MAAGAGRCPGSDVRGPATRRITPSTLASSTLVRSTLASSTLVRSTLAWSTLVWSITGVPTATGGDRGLVDTSRSPHAAVAMVDLDDVRWGDGLLAERFAACRDSMIPYLWTVLRDPQESHAWDNFLMAAGQGEGRGDGRPHGPPFNDGDFLKWLEALIQAEAVAPTETRAAATAVAMPTVDEIIAVVAKAQRDDGYLHTPVIVRQRRGQADAREFTDREHFETYNMGHLITAACVHHRATGKTSLLDCGRKAADWIDRLARERPGELARHAICPSHAMGIVELHRATRDPRYLELARRLLDIRGLVPPDVGGDQNQDRIPFREATEAVGHAVRANYLYAGVADLVAESGDETLLTPLRAIDRDVAQRKRAVTGMTGALYDGASPDGAPARLHPAIKTVHQAYGRGYQLPNLTAYNETCATIGYGMWLWRMLLVTGAARYADLFEETLYNGILPGVSLDGRSYFYVNPLRTLRDYTVPLRWSRSRMATIPSSFCCPPNVARTIAEAHNYVYTVSPGTVWIQLYASSTLDTVIPRAGRLTLRQVTDYPWSGAVAVEITEAPAQEVTLQLRIPGWAGRGAALRINGAAVPDQPRPGAYAAITHRFQAGDRVELDLAMEPTLLEAHPFVEETFGQVAVRNGPLIYCLESVDLPDGVRLGDVLVRARDPRFRVDAGDVAGSPVRIVTAAGLVRDRPGWGSGDLYRPVADRPSIPVDLRFIPYYAWGNRSAAEMTVWLPATW